MKSKKVVAVILVLAMMAALVLSSCGGGDKPAASSDSPANTPAADSDTSGASGGGSAEAGQIVEAALAYSDQILSEISDDAVSSKDSLTFAAISDPGKITLDNLLEFTQYPIATAAVEYFIRYNFKEAKYYSPVCDSYDTDADNKGVTFHITPGITMNDGNIFGSADLIASIEAFRIHNGLGWQLDFVDLDKADIIDDNTIYLPFTFSNGVWESGFQMLTLLSGEAYNAVNGDESFFQAPIGPQAYDVSEWVAGDHITFTRNDDYYRGTPPIKTLTMKVISDRTAAYMALQNGDIDLLWNISADQVVSTYNSDNLEQVIMGENMMIFLGMNSGGNEALKDFRVREAISLAVNRQDIIDGAYDGLAFPSTSILTKEAVGYDPAWDTTSTIPAQDVEKAKSLLADAGYGDGLTLRLIAESTINFQLVTEQLAAQLEQVGITLDPQLADYATTNSIMFSSDVSGYDLFLFVCQTSDDGISTIDNPMLYGATHPELAGDNAGEGWFAIFDAIRAAKNIDERVTLYRDLNTYFFEKGEFWVPLAVSQTYVAFDKDLTGLRRNGFMIYFEDAYYR
ncbi:MAG: ABC transporter substrate-binding protein [Clostridiales Family XIII bacterium]|jgi:peptide/nickel transport system substrate-binding protein|nr:ABC transporter substrate-binding protein [Clostridiales Family XIII bacterium]